ncbi:MAG: UbiA family prenyltransferase [Bdellovibrionales bacterium]
MNFILKDQIDERKYPLVIDLDGTLVKTDLLHEAYCDSFTHGFRHHLKCASAFLRGGRSSLKAYLAQESNVDHTKLPYNEAVLELIRAARRDGRPVYLATASNHLHAEAIASHLGLFDGVFASDDKTNLKAEVKAQTLADRFGKKNFDYVGNSTADIPIWAISHKVYAVNVSAQTQRKINKLGLPTEYLFEQKHILKSWGKALRVHQYAKNALLFVPMLTSHTYALSSFLVGSLAFLSFSLCASSVYIFNDLIDLTADRQHPTKCNRPFAKGSIPIAQGAIIAPILLVIAFSLALLISPIFTATIAAYFIITVVYTAYLKRKMIIDVVVLAMLYTLRVIAGAVAIDVNLSEWLLVFSMFIFTCLALVKRYVELAARIDGNLPDPSNRNYKLRDLPVIGALAAASGFNAITIFSLYISSPAVRELYRHPQFLWLVCPILMYWVGRLLVLAHRRIIHDDPVFFALRDRNSYFAICAMGIIVLLAS